jgi:hypothetical protein
MDVSLHGPNILSFVVQNCIQINLINQITAASRSTSLDRYRDGTLLAICTTILVAPFLVLSPFLHNYAASR